MSNQNECYIESQAKYLDAAILAGNFEYSITFDFEESPELYVATGHKVP